MKLAELYRTTWACPSQWHGITEDGRHVYIRFRHGELTKGIGETYTDAVANSSDSDPIKPGEQWDGFLPCSLMLELTGIEAPDGYERVQE